MKMGAVLGFLAGAFIGSSFGIAGMGTAIAGTIPFGILGAYFGYRIHQGMVSRPVVVENGPTAEGRDSISKPQTANAETSQPVYAKIHWEHVPYNDFDRGLPSHILNDGLQLGIRGSSDLSDNNQGIVRMRFNNWRTGRGEVELKINKIWLRQAALKKTYWIVEVREFPDKEHQSINRGCVSSSRQAKAVKLAQEAVNSNFLGTESFVNSLRRGLHSAF